MSWAVYQRAAMEEEHRQLPSTAGSLVNMDALLTALLETAGIKPFVLALWPGWLCKFIGQKQWSVYCKPSLLPEPVTFSDIWAPSQIFGFTLVFRILRIDERKYIMVSKVGREGSGRRKGEKGREERRERKEEKSIGKKENGHRERGWASLEDGLCFRNSISVFVHCEKQWTAHSFPSNQEGKWYKRIFLWYALLCLFFW